LYFAFKVDKIILSSKTKNDKFLSDVIPFSTRQSGGYVSSTLSNQLFTSAC